MMIMAHHPQKQAHQEREVMREEGENSHPDIINKHGKQTRGKMNLIPAGKTTISSVDDRNIITNSTSSHLSTHSEKQQRQQIQDGRRTLIKNQLYLIEQLQIENANLRNERDQLQLENEELKFQLQMISSSNIIGQSGTAFNDDRQLERLVENDSAGPTANNSSVIDNLPTRQQVNSRPSSCLPLTTFSDAGHLATGRTTTPSIANNSLGNNHYNYHQVINSSSGLANLTATPLRQPLKQTTQSNQQQPHNHLSTSQIPLSSMSNLDCYRKKLGTNSEFDASLYTKAQTMMSSNGIGEYKNSKHLHAKSLACLNDERADPTSRSFSAAQTDDLLTINRDDEQDEQARSRLVQELYGCDSEKVNAAAITIQRAFRKYQISQRFRAITDQLRQASKMSPLRLRANHRQSIDHVDNLSPKAKMKSDDNKSNACPTVHVSGATRLAAWESLSQAASRLAASAASATASTKQVLSGTGVAKSASCQHVATTNATTNNQTATRSRSNRQTNLATGNTTNDRPSQFKGNSVVAAAINFQQLESIRKRQYRVGLNVFNKSPEKGVSYLIEHSFIDCNPPYMKTSTSYYLSNQLHFIDKQQLTAQQQSITTTNAITDGNKLDQNCRLCREEENLKRNVAHFLLHRKGLAKEKIGQYLGNLQSQFNQDVLIYYLQELDFNGLQVDVALRKFSSTMRMPGEAQKIERFVDCFAQRYVQCQQNQQVINDFSNSNQTIQLSANNGVVRMDTDWNTTNQTSNDQQSAAIKNNLTLLSKDEIFILTFAIIMLNTDLHSPSLKSTSRMSRDQFIHNLRGVFKSQTINESDLIEIYERVKANQITTMPDHVTHVMKVQQGLTTNNFQKKELPNLCVPYRRLVCFCRLFEVYDINKKERVGQHQREIFLFNDMLLVTKFSRRPRANTPQQYTYRQSITLLGLYVQLFQSAHYNFGIKLCRRSNDETLIMFNARNELDQSRFVDDLNESIAEMDEMESIKMSNLIDAIHSKQMDRLRRHAMLHERENVKIQTLGHETNEQVGVPDKQCDIHMDDEEDLDKETVMTLSSGDVTVISSGTRRLSAKFSSMSNLASVAENKDGEESAASNVGDKQLNGFRKNRSSVQQSRLPIIGYRRHQQLGPLRSNSSTSVHSLDSGLFLSRDVSPNQSG